MKDDGRLQELGKKVKIVRTRMGISQTHLAHKIGKDQPSINRLERGRVNPSFIFLLEVCEGLEMDLPDLLETELEF